MLDRSKAPQIKPFGHLVLPSCDVTVLDNGLTLHMLSGGDQDIVRLSLIFEGGPDDCSNPCVATFAAELMREGNCLHDSEQLADLLDYNGAWLTSSATGHYTTLRLSALTSKLTALLPDFVASVTSPTFNREPFEVIRIKAAARQRLNLSRVNFLAMLDNRRLICGPDNPSSRMLTPETIEATDCNDVVAFHYNRLDSRRMHAFLAGKLNADIIDEVRRALSAIEPRDRVSPIKIVPFEPLPPQLSKIVRSDSLQSAVALSLPAVGRDHHDYNTLRMAVTALGGYFGSRLMSNIREDKGYTYGISASLLGAQEGSYVTINAQCDNAYTDAMIDEVRHELVDMVERPLSDAELERLRFNVASDLATTLDSPLAVTDYYELPVTLGVPVDYFEARQRLLSEIDADTICRMARKYLKPDQLRISVAGR